jgi:hypothetical protein
MRGVAPHLTHHDGVNRDRVERVFVFVGPGVYYGLLEHTQNFSAVARYAALAFGAPISFGLTPEEGRRHSKRSVHVSSEEKRDIETAAREAGVSVSFWIYYGLVYVLQELDSMRRGGYFDPDIQDPGFDPHEAYKSHIKYIETYARS